MAHLPVVTHRTHAIRKLCVKAFFYYVIDSVSADTVINLSHQRKRNLAQLLYIRLDIKDGETPNAIVLGYFEDVCKVLVETVALLDADDIVLCVVLDKKELFPPKFWNIHLMNKMAKNKFVDSDFIRSQFQRTAKEEILRRKQTINLMEILDVLEKDPQKYFQVYNVALHVNMIVMQLVGREAEYFLGKRQLQL